LIAGATAARIERFIRLTLRHDATGRRRGKAAIASENWARDIEVICPGRGSWPQSRGSAGSIDLLLVWRYARIARSIPELVNALEEFRSLGIDFIGYRKNAGTTTAQGKLIFGIMASPAERALVAERVKAGMARAKAQGKHVARPPTA
jgi:Resolvase, N terminal domain